MMRSYIAGLVMALVFGLSFLAEKAALDIFSECSMLAWRFVIAALILYISRKIGLIRVELRNKPWYKLVAISLLYPVLSFALEAKGVGILPSSQAGVIMSLVPVIASMISAVFLGEHPVKEQIFMIFLSVIGVILITVGTNDIGQTRNIKGIWIMLCCACCVAVQTVLVRKQSRCFSSIEITYVMNFTAAIIFNIILGVCNGRNIIRNHLMPFATWEGDISILYLSVGCSIIAFFALNYVNAHLEVARASVFVNLSTVVSMISGILWGNESAVLSQWIGMICIVIGVWGVNHFKSVHS